MYLNNPCNQKILYPKGESSPVVKKCTNKNKIKIIMMIKKIFLFSKIFFKKLSNFILY